MVPAYKETYDSGTDFVLSESQAIMKYLCDTRSSHLTTELYPHDNP